MRFDDFDRLFAPPELAAQLRAATLSVERDLARLRDVGQEDLEAHLHGVEMGFALALEESDP